jgi:nitroreductase/dihydropteridine reductase
MTGEDNKPPPTAGSLIRQGVDATPLEGFDPTSVDKAFKIRENGHTTTVLLALGYPDPDKQYSNPISRFDADQLFTFI